MIAKMLKKLYTL